MVQTSLKIRQITAIFESEGPLSVCVVDMAGSGVPCVFANRGQTPCGWLDVSVASSPPGARVNTP